MPPRSRSSTGKAQKGASAAAIVRQNSGTPPVAAEVKKELGPSSISGCYPGLYKKAKRLMGKPSASLFSLSRRLCSRAASLD